MEKEPQEVQPEELTDEERAARLLESMRKIDFNFITKLTYLPGNPFYEDARAGSSED